MIEPRDPIIGGIHEGSHGALVRYLGLPLSYIIIDNKTGEALDGNCMYTGGPSELQEAMIGCAGYIGECIFQFQIPTLEGMSLSTTSQDDYSRIKDYPNVGVVFQEVVDILTDIFATCSPYYGAP